MGHSRKEGHSVHGVTQPHDGMILTQAITQGRTDDFDFTLGHIVGSLQGDLLLTVTFADGEQVTERLDMAGMLADWTGEVQHSKRMRDVFPVNHVWPVGKDG